MYWHIQYPAANAIGLLLCTDMPSLHRRSSHPRWVLTRHLTTVSSTVVKFPVRTHWSLNPDRPWTEPKQPAWEIPCSSSLTSSEAMWDTHTKQIHTNTPSTECDVRSNSCSLTYRPWLRAAAGSPVSPEDAVGCQLQFRFPRHSIQSWAAKSHWLLPYCTDPEGHIE